MNSKAETGRLEVRAGGQRGATDVRAARRTEEARKTPKERKSEQERYFDEARSWEANRTADGERKKRFAYVVAGVAVAIAAVNSLATVILATREPPPPVVLNTNETTGSTTMLTHLKGGDEVTYDEVQNKFWTETYISKREGFLKAMAEENYKAVGLMSCGSERKRYLEWFSPKNTQSPLNVYGDAAKAEIAIVSTTFIKPKLALTRYKRLVRRPGVDKPETTYWAATVGFDYAGGAMKEADRRVNPLGYQVCEYRIDPDAASDVNAAVTQPIATPQQPATPTVAVQLYPGQPPVQVPAPARTAATQGGQ